MPDVPYEHPPDGVMLLPDSRRIAIEIQRSIENYSILEETFLDLLENYSEVYYFATKSVEPVLIEAQSRLNLDQQERITIYAVLED